MMYDVFKYWAIGILILIPINWFAAYRRRSFNVWVSILWPLFLLINTGKFIWKIIYILIYGRSNKKSTRTN